MGGGCEPAAPVNRSVTQGMAECVTQCQVECGQGRPSLGGSVMARPLTVGPPTASQLRRIHQCLESPLRPTQRRRAEALLLLAAGHTATFIAHLLGAHVNTIYADLRA